MELNPKVSVSRGSLLNSGKNFCTKRWYPVQYPSDRHEGVPRDSRRRFYFHVSDFRLLIQRTVCFRNCLSSTLVLCDLSYGMLMWQVMHWLKWRSHGALPMDCRRGYLGEIRVWAGRALLAIPEVLFLNCTSPSLNTLSGSPQSSNRDWMGSLLQAC